MHSILDKHKLLRQFTPCYLPSATDFKKETTERKTRKTKKTRKNLLTMLNGQNNSRWVQICPQSKFTPSCSLVSLPSTNHQPSRIKSLALHVGPLTTTHNRGCVCDHLKLYIISSLPYFTLSDALGWVRVQGYRQDARANAMPDWELDISELR